MSGSHSEVAPRLPIPNRTVKRLSADDSADTRVKVGHCQTPHTTAQLERSSWALCFGAGVFVARPDALLAGQRWPQGLALPP